MASDKHAPETDSHRHPAAAVTTLHRDKQAIIAQVYDHVMWRVRSDRVSQITSLLVKLAIEDGYKRGRLKAECYPEVAGCFADWRAAKLIKLYAFGNAPPSDQKLVLASTTNGDLTKWVANYIDGSEKRQNPELIGKLAGALRDRTQNCIFITNDPGDAARSLETGAIRCVLLLDRPQRSSGEQPAAGSSAGRIQLEPLESAIRKGKVFVVSSLNCVQFAPDPTSAETCC